MNEESENELSMEEKVSKLSAASTKTALKEAFAELGIVLDSDDGRKPLQVLRAQAINEIVAMRMNAMKLEMKNDMKGANEIDSAPAAGKVVSTGNNNHDAIQIKELTTSEPINSTGNPKVTLRPLALTIPDNFNETIAIASAQATSMAQIWIKSLDDPIPKSGDREVLEKLGDLK